MLFKLFSNKCSMCKKKQKHLYNHINRAGKAIKVCSECGIYAERRAFKKNA